MSSHIVLEEPTVKPGEEAEKSTRRAFLIAAGAAGLCYTAADGISDLSLPGLAGRDGLQRDGGERSLPEGCAEAACGIGADVQVRQHRPAMLIHHADGTWASLICGVHPPGMHGAV